MLDCVRGRCTLESATNSEEAFFINEWVQLVKVAVELDNAVFFSAHFGDPEIGCRYLQAY